MWQSLIHCVHMTKFFLIVPFPSLLRHFEATLSLILLHLLFSSDRYKCLPFGLRRVRETKVPERLAWTQIIAWHEDVVLSATALNITICYKSAVLECACAARSLCSCLYSCCETWGFHRGSHEELVSRTWHLVIGENQLTHQMKMFLAWLTLPPWRWR
jgi:hypothetical protein